MIIYTLHYLESGEVIQSGDCPNEECLPLVPEGAVITQGFAAIRGEERVINGARVPYQEPLEYDALIVAIERERTRRLHAGFDYDFGDARGVHRIGTTEADEHGWDKVTKLAGAMIASNNPGAEIFIVTNTGPVIVTALEWQYILIAAGSFQQPIYAASFALQMQNPIPQDVENPEHWSN